MQLETVVDIPRPRPRSAPVPHLRLCVDRFLVEDARARGGYREARLPALVVAFDYDGVQVRATGEQDGAYEADLQGRDRAAEWRALALLESLGALDLDCVEHVVAGHDSLATHLVHVDGEVNAVCSFAQHALPRLRDAGFAVEIDAAYPYQVVEPGEWFARATRASDHPDWFSLELGVDVGGERVDLLPALLDLISGCAEGDAIEALARSVARFRALKLADGRYLCFAPEQVERLLRVVIELYGGEPPPRPEPLPVCAPLFALPAALPGENLELIGEPRLLARVRAFGSQPAPSSPPKALPVELRPYQRAGLDWLAHLREHELGGVLADDMGLGKTLQTIAHLQREHEAGRDHEPTLVVVPTSLVGNWRRELARFAPGLRVVTLHGAGRRAEWRNVPNANVVLTTYPVLVRDADRLSAQSWHYAILDEAQAIKNERSLAKRAASRLVARHRLALSGTPVENDLGELWSLFDFTSPGLLGDLASFRRRFALPIERDANQVALQSLRALVRPLLLRRTKEGVVRELPPRTSELCRIDLGPTQRELYESLRVAAHADVRRAIRQKGFAASSVIILDALMKLRQACCDPRLVDVDAARDTRESAKTAAFFDLLDSLLGSGRRVLVFSQFARMLGLLSRGLDERGVGHVTLTGATQDRQQLVDRFERGGVSVFLISLKAGGTGLNLVSADSVIHYDPWWNAAARAQATDRAYRIGQTKPVTVYDLIARGSVEERMLVLQEKKRRLMASLFEDDAERSSAPWSEDEVFELLAPLRA